MSERTQRSEEMNEWSSARIAICWNNPGIYPHLNKHGDILHGEHAFNRQSDEYVRSHYAQSSKRFLKDENNGNNEIVKKDGKTKISKYEYE